MIKAKDYWSSLYWYGAKHCKRCQKVQFKNCALKPVDLSVCLLWDGGGGG
jgi:hypothetical protein